MLNGENIQESISLCERAISLNSSKPFYWNNYVVTLRNVGLFKKNNEYIEQSFTYFERYPSLVGNELFMSGVFLLRPDLIEKAISGLKRVGISLSDIGVSQEDMMTVMLMSENVEQIEKLRPMIDSIVEIIDQKYKGPISTLLKKDMMDETVSYVFKVNLDAEKASCLNEKLFDALYEKNLLSSDCCAYIEPRG